MTIPPRHRLVAAECLTWAGWLFSLSFVLVLGDELLADPITVDTEATTLVSTPTELLNAAHHAAPGTTIRIAPGEYPGGLHFRKVTGKPGQPIIFVAADADRPPVFSGGGSSLHFSEVQYIELHDLIIVGASGNGLNIDDGGQRNTPATHILLRNLHIKDVGPEGNRDGIKLSGVDHFTVSNCTIERWGRGGSAIDMVGCHHGRVDACVFRHESQLSANGVQTKGGSAEIVIQRCRFEQAGSRAVNIGGSTGRDYFRPPNVNYEAKDIIVEDCTFIGSVAPIAFVGVDGAIVRYNTVYHPQKWVARILQETRAAEFVPCRRGVFTNNLVVIGADLIPGIINIGSGTAPDSFRFADNYWFCSDAPARSRLIDLPTVESGGVYGMDPQFVDDQQLDLRLRLTSPVRNAGARTAHQLPPN